MYVFDLFNPRIYKYPIVLVFFYRTKKCTSTVLLLTQLDSLVIFRYFENIILYIDVVSNFLP